MKEETKPIPDNPYLYEKAKKIVKARYKNPRSPFLSGAIVIEYKKLGGSYTGDKNKTKLKRWFDEKWVNANPIVGKQQDAYAFFRPTVRVSEKTPATIQELKPQLNKYVIEKQKTKYGNQVKQIDYDNFKPTKVGGMIVRAQPYSKGRFDNQP
jgi:hypothetical protein